MKKLYKVKFINQVTGKPTSYYVLSENVEDIVNDYADIITITFINNFDDLTEDL
jgi:hypothetical protein